MASGDPGRQAGRPSAPSTPGLEERKGARYCTEVSSDLLVPTVSWLPSLEQLPAPGTTSVLNQLETEFSVISLAYVQSKQEHLMAGPLAIPGRPLPGCSNVPWPSRGNIIKRAFV